MGVVFDDVLTRVRGRAFEVNCAAFVYWVSVGIVEGAKN